MNLRDYLYKHNVTQKDFAKAIGYSEVAIKKYIAHMSKCSDKLAKAVNLYTKGTVSEKEMIEWNLKGMEEKKKKEADAFPAKVRREFVNEMCTHVCASCKKKLTKAGYITKKES
jgi:transcriptional regulator with XRE-family HTH domain